MRQIFYSVLRRVSPTKQLEEGVENGCIEIEVPGRRRRTLTTSTMRGTSMAIMATSTTMTATTTTPFGVWGVEAGVEEKVPNPIFQSARSSFTSGRA